MQWRKVVLPNGLRALLACGVRCEKFSLHALLGAGSRCDPEGGKGLAHVVEHLATVPTESSSPAGLRGYVSTAHTQFEHTYYYWTCEPLQYAELIQLAARRFSGLEPSLTRHLPSQIRTVRREIELKSRRPYLGRLYQALYRTAFRRHPYRWYTLGQPAHLGRLSRRRARNFIAAHYHPGNMVLVLMGPIPSRAMERALRLYWEELRPGSRAKHPPVREPAQTRQRRALVRAPEARQRLLLGLKAPGFEPRREPALQLLQCLLINRTFLDSLNREGQLKALYTKLPIARDARLFEIFIEFKPGYPISWVEPKLFERFKDISEGKVTAGELREARSRAIKNFRAKQANPPEMGEPLGAHELLGTGHEQFLNLPASLRCVQARDVFRMARQVLSGRRATIVSGASHV